MSGILRRMQPISARARALQQSAALAAARADAALIDTATAVNQDVAAISSAFWGRSLTPARSATTQAIFRPGGQFGGGRGREMSTLSASAASGGGGGGRFCGGGGRWGRHGAAAGGGIQRRGLSDVSALSTFGSAFTAMAEAGDAHASAFSIATAADASSVPAAPIQRVDFFRADNNHYGSRHQLLEAGEAARLRHGDSQDWECALGQRL